MVFLVPRPSAICIFTTVFFGSSCLTLYEGLYEKHTGNWKLLFVPPPPTLGIRTPASLTTPLFFNWIVLASIILSTLSRSNNFPFNLILISSSNFAVVSDVDDIIDDDCWPSSNGVLTTRSSPCSKERRTIPVHWWWVPNGLCTHSVILLHSAILVLRFSTSCNPGSETCNGALSIIKPSEEIFFWRARSENVIEKKYRIPVICERIMFLWKHLTICRFLSHRGILLKEMK